MCQLKTSIADISENVQNCKLWQIFSFAYICKAEELAKLQEQQIICQENFDTIVQLIVFCKSVAIEVQNKWQDALTMVTVNIKTY